MFSFIRKNETFLYPRDDTLFLANLILTCAWLYSHRIVAITTQAISSSVWRANLSRPFFVCSPWANKNKEDERGEMEPCKCWSRSFDPGKKFFQSNFLAGIHILLVKRNFSKRSFLEEEKYLAVYPVLATQLGVFVVSPFFPALLVMSLHLHVRPVSAFQWANTGSLLFSSRPNKTWRADGFLFAENPSSNVTDFGPFKDMKRRLEYDIPCVVDVSLDEGEMARNELDGDMKRCCWWRTMFVQLSAREEVF